MKKVRYFLPVFLVFIFIICFNGLRAQTNVSVPTATLVNSFPYVETNVNSINGGTATGMNGSCSQIPCCSTLVYRVETPSYGSLRVENSNYQPLTGSIIAYTPDIDNPQDWSDLTYYSAVGNFCGFRDTLQLGYGFTWYDYGSATDGYWKVNATQAQAIPPGTYYVLLWNYNNQSGSGTISDFSFRFAQYCPDGYSCSSTSVTLCDGDGYTSPQGNLYTTSGNYQDTLFGAAQGGLDSLIFTNLTINNTAYTQDLITDETLCLGTDTLKQASTTDRVSYANIVKTDANWIECNNVVPSLINTNRSIFVWMKKSTTVSGSSQMLVGINTSGTGNICNLQIGTNEKLGIYDGSNSHYTTTVITDGNWHFVGYTYDETTDSTKMYVDGVMEGKYKNSQSIGASTDRISLGQEFDGSTKSNFLDGLLTEVSIWDEVLDSAEIASIMNEAINSSHPKYANLQAYYPMMITCGASTQIINDYSSNSNHGLASHDDLQILTALEQITGFNSAAHYTKNWTASGSTVATSDSLIKTSYAGGSYQLELSRDYFSITDDWVVTLDPNCSGGGCTETTSTISPTTCDSYTSPSTNYTWTTSNTYKDTIPNAAGCDSVITINLTIKISTTGTDTQTACDSYTWIDGNTYTTSNNAATHTLTNAVNCDSVVTLNLTINQSTTGTDTQTACDSYTWIDGNTYTTSNNSATHTLTNAANCDSIVTLNLTINQSNTGTDTQTACDSYTWIDGNTYTTSNNSATHTLTNAANCDSVVTLNLTINQSTTGTDTQTACDTYTWIDGNTYTTSNNSATHTLTNVANCDSVVTLNLTINNSTTGTDTQTACDSYTWIDGNTYTTSNNSATHTLTNAANCDSVVTLNLTINHSTTGTDTQVACDSYTWIDGNTYTSSNNTATHTLTNVANCDSVVTLNLTINHSTTGTDTQVACDSYTWIDGNTYTSSNNTATHTLTNVANCDSVVTLNLTINQSTTGADTQTACDSYTWIDGNTYTSNNNTATHTLTNALGCDSVVTLNLTIQHSPLASAGTDITICEDDVYTLSGAATNQQSVLWTTDGNGSFDDASLLDADYTPGTDDITAGTVTLTLTAHSISPCAIDDTDDMIITIQKLPTADAGNDAIICEDATYMLSGTATNHQSVLWTTTGDGSFDNDILLSPIYTPGTNDLLSGYVTLIITSYALSPCSTEDTDDMEITIQGLPTAFAGIDATICEDATYTLSGVATNQLSVLWTTAGDGSFDDATSLTAIYTPGSSDLAIGSVTLTLTSYALSPCATEDIDDIEITIQDLPITDAGNDATICEDATYTLSGYAINYTSLLWTTTGDGSFDDNSLGSATYTPGPNDISSGSATLTLTATSTSPCGGSDSDEIEISFQELPTVNAGADALICEDATYALLGAATNYQLVLWTTSGDGSFVNHTSLNAIYTPGVNDISAETVTLTLTSVALYPCGDNATDDMEITIQQLPTANAGDDVTFCENTSLTLSATATNYETVQWSTSGDGSFSNAGLLDAIYTPGSNDLSLGTATLTLTAFTVSPCGTDAADNMVITIQDLPTADAGEDAAICEDATHSLSGTATNYESVLWTTSGDGSFDDANSPNTTYSPGSGDISSGITTLTLTAFAFNSCTTNASSNITLAIQGLPTSNAGSSATICQDESYLLSGSATNYQSLLWGTNGDGSFDDEYILDATYTPGPADILQGYVHLYLFAYSNSPCTGYQGDAMVLTINSYPIVSAGNNAEICLDESYLLYGSAQYYESMLWTTAGDGSFDNATLLNAVYTPGSNDISNGNVEITLTVSPNPVCGGDDVSNSMILSIFDIPEQPTTPEGPIAIDLDFVVSSEYLTTLEENVSSYHWNLEPSDAGYCEWENNIVTVYWNTDFIGLTVTLNVVAINDCGETISEDLEISVSPVGINQSSGQHIDVQISPNPSKGRFNITIIGATDDIELVVINTSGQIIAKERLINTNDKYVKWIDISEELPGTYYLKFITGTGVITKKVIIGKSF